MGPIVGGTNKGVKIRFAPVGADPKHSAIVVVVRPAIIGRAVEIAVAALYQPGFWIVSIFGGADKGVKIRLRLCCGMERPTRQNQQDNDQWNAKYLHDFSSFLFIDAWFSFLEPSSVVVRFAVEAKGAQPGMVHRVVNAAWVVVSLPFRPHGCAPHADFLWRDVKPIEALRLQRSAEVGQGQNTADTVGDGYRDIRPASRGQRVAVLQLIRFACDGDY